MGKRVKIILSKDVVNLGEEGDIREVAAGYARNYLFPKQFASTYNQHALTILKQRQKKIEKRKEEKRILAQGMKERLQEEKLVFVMPAGENGKLFGSITNGQIMEELQKKGYTLEKKRIEVPEHHIKMVGNYTVIVKLYENEEAELKVTVEAQETEKKEEKSKKAGKGERSRKREKQETEEAPVTEEEGEETPEILQDENDTEDAGEDA